MLRSLTIKYFFLVFVEVILRRKEGQKMRLAEKGCKLLAAKG